MLEIPFDNNLTQMHAKYRAFNVQYLNRSTRKVVHIHAWVHYIARDVGCVVQNCLITGHYARLITPLAVLTSLLLTLHIITHFKRVQSDRNDIAFMIHSQKIHIKQMY